MDWKFIVAIVSVLLTLVGYYPYFRDIFKRKTTPHLYTWLIWGITQGTGSIAAFYGGASFGAASLAVGTVLVFVITLLSFKYGTKNITKGDRYTLAAAVAAIVLWWLTNDPLYSVIMVTVIDAVGYWPTIRKSYAEPWSETLWFWGLMAFINILIILAVKEHNILTVLYPSMMFVANSAVLFVCVLRRK